MYLKIRIQRELFYRFHGATDIERIVYVERIFLK